jgi:hypothetical protein
MSSETRKLDGAAIAQLEALVASAGGNQQVAAGMAAAYGTTAPSKGQIASQAQRLRRILKSGDVTIKSLDLIAAALGWPLSELLALLFDQRMVSADSAAREADVAKSHTQDESGSSSSRWRLPETETGRLNRRLNKASELTTSRTNVVRDEPGLPVITLQDQLYIRRDIEDQIARALEERTSEAVFIVVDGEAGTGKSSVLWATERMLKERGTDAWLIDAIELDRVFGPGRDGTILSEPFRKLFRNLAAENRAPVLLIDTIDVPLNRSGADLYITSLLIELALADVTVIAASRPGEARMLSAHAGHDPAV